MGDGRSQYVPEGVNSPWSDELVALTCETICTVCRGAPQHRHPLAAKNFAGRYGLVEIDSTCEDGLAVFLFGTPGGVEEYPGLAAFLNAGWAID